jgi:S1-C subfamily serine protease
MAQQRLDRRTRRHDREVRMASGLVIHISAGDDKHTEILTGEQIRIGKSDLCDLRLRASDLPAIPSAGDVVLEVNRASGVYRVTNFDPLLEITHNGIPLTHESEIKDGDEVRINRSNLALQFFPIRSLPAVVPAAQHETHVAPFIEAAAIESAATARRDDAKVFLREFTREFVREVSITTKLITLGIALALVGGILYIGFALFREIQTARRVADNQREQLAQMKEQVARTNQQLSDITRSNNDIRNSLSLAPKLRTDFGSGVCLIAGSFYYVEPGTGRPLRYSEAQTGENGAAIPSGSEQSSLTPEGKGAIAEYGFVGSGFYVGKGYVVTNRHIAQPWLADDRAQSIGSSVGGQPRLKKLMAYFPDHAQPIALKVKQAGRQEDVAVCVMDIKDLPQDIPELKLEMEAESDTAAVGKPVVMMGYPSGTDRLLAQLDDALARDIQQRYGGSLDTLLGYLAEKKLIQPLMTQGNITALDVRRIAYDARTAEGGSGAPLFGPSGKVIGVNFALFTENQASNFAVPIRFAVTLLERSEWEPPAEKENPAETSAASSTAPHTSATP